MTLPINMPPRPARPTPAPRVRRAPREPTTRGGGIESFDEAELLAELGGDDGEDEGEANDDDDESHEELEARLMRELAAMPDAHAAEEKALLASINNMEEEPDEGIGKKVRFHSTFHPVHHSISSFCICTCSVRRSRLIQRKRRLQT